MSGSGPVGRLRVPVVAGFDDGVGTSTLCAGLHAREAGDRETAADIVVCGGGAAVARAAVGRSPSGARPVLAVATTPGTPGPSAERLRVLGSRFAAVVPVPWVDAWQGLAPPPAGAALLLGLPADQLPAGLRAYAAALRTIAAAVLRSGQLRHPAPPYAVRPRTAGAWLPLRPAVRPEPVAPLLLSAPTRLRPLPAPRAGAGRLREHDLDDDALEAAGFARATARTGQVG